MKCPSCGHDSSRVVDSREVDQGIRRRRMCLRCGTRFTTYERIQRRSLFVVKKDGRREEFDRDKISAGIGKACEKRPLPQGVIEKIVDNIETDLLGKGKCEVSSSVVGDMVAERLGQLDPIAYIRFTSVYREFNDLEVLKQAVDALVSQQSRERVSVSQLPLLPDDDSSETRRRRAGVARRSAALRRSQ